MEKNEWKMFFWNQSLSKRGRSLVRSVIKSTSCYLNADKDCMLSSLMTSVGGRAAATRLDL